MSAFGGKADIKFGGSNVVAYVRRGRRLLDLAWAHSLSYANRLYEYPNWPRLAPLATSSLLIFSIVL